jgi:hypothetical protein
MAGDKQSGMRNWFKEHLPFKILNHLPNVDIDNPYNGVGLTMGWDSRYRRVFLTKKDYIPKNDCIQYIEGQGFVIDDTVCNGEPATISCPAGYTLVGNVCQRNSETVNLCPDGWEYDSENKICVLIETVEAECVCTANVTASPQTICSGDTTSIALTSTEPGVSFSWTALASGVTGAASGSGLAIAQTLSGAGTVTYTVTPFEIESGCPGETIEVVVTVNATPNIVATPASPQNINSGDTVEIALSSSTSGATFSWTVTQTSGLTGASSGSGSTISDTLTSAGAGTATYHIVATSPNGCTSTLDYVVSVGPEIVACLGDFEIVVDYLNTGCATGHTCNIAKFYLKGNGVTIGIANLNNNGGPEDQLNYPPGVTSGPTRYNIFNLTTQQAQDIAAASTDGNITFSLDCFYTSCHTSASHMVIRRNGVEIYNNCPNGNTFTINPCTGVVTP